MKLHRKKKQATFSHYWQHMYHALSKFSTSSSSEVPQSLEKQIIISFMVCDGHNSNQLVKPMNCEPIILAESNSFQQQNNFHSIYTKHGWQAGMTGM
jgi:hypothetical protein